MRMTSVMRSAFLLLIWLILTATVAFVVSRESVRSDSANVLQPIPVISITDRPVAGLKDVTIQPVVAASATVREESGTWILSGAVQPADVAYRLLEAPVGVKARIDGGPSGFDCTWIGLDQAAEGGVAATCAIPDSVTVVAGMTGTMVIQLDEPQRVSGLPVTAVIGSEGTGQVIVVVDGTRELRSVTIGTHDDLHVEIVDGLEPGEQVLEFPNQMDVNEALAQ